MTSSSWRSSLSGWFSISAMSKRGSRSRYSAQAPCWKLRSTTQVEAPRVVELMQLKRRLQGQGRGADAAGGRHEGVDLRFRIFLAARALEDADAGTHQIGGLDRLDQKVGDLELDEDAYRCGVEFLGHHEDRRLAFQAPGHALQRLDLFELCRIHVDDDGVAVGFLDLAAQLDDVLIDDLKLDQVRRRERRLGFLSEHLVGRDQDDPLGFSGSGHAVAYAFLKLQLELDCASLAAAASSASPGWLVRAAGTRSRVFCTPSCHGSTICMTVFAACELPAPSVTYSDRAVVFAHAARADEQRAGQNG